MNKKIIAIAIATAMAAPVAMADVKISGRVGGSLVSVSGDTLSPAVAADQLILDALKASGFNTGATAVAEATGDTSTSFVEQGMNRLVFDGTSGNGYARVAFNTSFAKASPTYRDQYVGYKAGFGKVQFGRMAGAMKNLEKDPYIATFLQLRGTLAAAGGKYGSNGFVDNLLQFSTKTNGIAFKVQYNPGAKTVAAKDEGHTALSVVGKAGGVSWWVGYNNAGGSEVTGDTNTKVGASMKFGSVKATLQLENNSYAGGTVEASRTLLMANMGLGNGLSVDAAFGMGGGDFDGASTVRIAVNKKLNKGTSLFAGYTSTDYDGPVISVLGAGMTVKF